MKYLKNLLQNINNFNNNENKLRIIGLLTILILLWVILYFIPSLFILLFHTLLGNLILVTITILALMNNKIYGIIIFILFIILFRFSRMTNITNTKININKNIKEGFVWSKESAEDFLRIQSTINRHKVFDTEMIQKNQANQTEVDYFNKHGMWPWSQKTIELYEQAIKNNPIIRTLPEDAITYARTIYNEAVILTILSHQTKEGQFLINGVLIKDPSGNKMEELPSGFGDFPYEVDLLEDRRDDIIRCGTINNSNSNSNTNTSESQLERVRYTGKGGIFGEQTKEITPVDYNNLENLVPGFEFLNKPCNPCVALNEKPDYSCPFRLNVKNKSPFISDVWQKLWNINDNPLESRPSFLSEYINPEQFPLLSELQNELNKNK